MGQKNRRTQAKREGQENPGVIYFTNDLFLINVKMQYSPITLGEM